MPRPTSQAELLEAMEREYAALWEEVVLCDQADLEAPGACEQWSVKDLLAHLDAWHELLLGWERIGAAGEKPEMPAPGLTWKDTPVLNAQIWERTKDDGWDQIAGRLDHSHTALRKLISSYEAEALFEKKRFKWTGSTSVGAYAVSATSSHYEWARKLVRRFRKAQAAGV
ncbi:MAG: ClbS/DfsB family four-helix bundle protein [bacterium]|nr:ClbS/DfsB family four-helix bundle protein [bacterium]